MPTRWLPSRPSHRLHPRAKSTCLHLTLPRHAAAFQPQALPHRNKTTMPYVVYSQSKREVTPLDVALLLDASRPPSFNHGTTQKAGYFSYWAPFSQQGVVRERMLQKLGQALSNSIAIAAAFTTSDVYEQGSQQHSTSGTDKATASSSTSQQGPATHQSANEAPDWHWVKGSGKQQRKRSLIGFVRATGDGSLTATIYDLAVHPEFRSFGIGTKLLRLLTQQLYQKEVYDIGSVVPLEAQRFFSRCCFEEDREQSTTLTFVQHHEWQAQGVVPGLLAADNWLLEGAMQQQQQQQMQQQQGQVQQQHGVSLVGPGEDKLQLRHVLQEVMLGEQGLGSWYGDDPLAAVPAPATQELQCNESLLAMMHDKLSQLVPVATAAPPVSPASVSPGGTTIGSPPAASVPAAPPTPPELDYHL